MIVLLWCVALTLTIYDLVPGTYAATDLGTGEEAARGIAGEDGLTLALPEGRYSVAPDTIQVPACPDLVVLGAEYSGWTVCGLPAEVRVEVGNTGVDPAAPSMTSVHVDGVEAGRAMVAGIPPGTSRWTSWVPIDPKPPPGQHVVSWCADVEQEVAEEDEGNNCAGSR